MYSQFKTETRLTLSVTLPCKLCKKKEIIIMKTQIAMTNSTILNDLPDVLTVTSPPRYGYTKREKP